MAITTERKHTKEPNLFKNYLTVIWPYFRDAFKGLKNGYKGFRSLTSMLSLLGVNSLHHLNLLIVPFSLALGVLSMANRIWYRRMKNGRKAAQDENKAIRKELLAKVTMTEMEASAFRANIRRYQPQALRKKAMASACYGGLIDGLYLYMGVFALAPLMGPLFFAVCAVSMLYVVLSVTSRLYEEYDYQNKLKASELELELLLSIKLLRTQLQDLHHLLERQKLVGDFPDEQELLNQQIKQLLEQESIAALRAKLLAQRQQLDTLLTLDNNLAFWSGLRSGLTAYGVAASVLFALGTILFLASVTFPPALLFAGVALGVACLVAFTVHSLVVNYRHRQEKSGLGLFTMETDPLIGSKESLKEQLQGRDGLVLYQEKLYYVNHYKNTVKPIRETSKNAAAITALKSKFVPWYSLADEEVLQQFKLLTGLTRNKVENPFSEMDELLYSLKNAETIVSQRQEKESIVDALERKGLAVDASPQYFFQEWFEIFRAWFSGVAKGSKSVDFMLNPLQATGKDGHYHAIPLMIWITIGSAIIYSVGFALRALARGFGGTSHTPKGSPVDEPSFTPVPSPLEELSPPLRTPCTSPIPSEGGIDGVVATTENSPRGMLPIHAAMDAAEGVTISELPENEVLGLVTDTQPTTLEEAEVNPNRQQAQNAARVGQGASLVNAAAALTHGGLSIFATQSPVRSRVVSPVQGASSPVPTPNVLLEAPPSTFLTPSFSPTC